jgi:UDP-N-acetyl-D-galactosamine dehydrogenase
MYQELLRKEKKLAVIGLGYVGLPIALLFARKISVVGFDINGERVEMMKKGNDPSGELPPQAFEGCDIIFTADPNDLREAVFYIVAVPTPIDRHKNPDLTPVLKASQTLARVLKKGDYVVYESTVYPGCTEEDCIPILETSGLKFPDDFYVGYSPERINPGDPVHTLSNTVKIVSGCNDEALDVIATVYELVIEAGVHRASSIKVAEAAKIIENTQRDLNIALMNELSLIFQRMNLNTYEVIEAAATKWNFQKFSPGLVGGHCIGVDPYYLTYKANELGYHAKVILAGREINDNMGFELGRQIVKKLITYGKNMRDSRVLVMGVTFKENVRDIRNSKVVDLISEMRSFMLNVDVVDAFADPAEVRHEYDLELLPQAGKGYDAVVVAVAHEPYTRLDENYFRGICNDDHPLLVDVKGIYRGKIKSMHYMSL